MAAIQPSLRRLGGVRVGAGRVDCAGVSFGWAISWMSDELAPESRVDDGMGVSTEVGGACTRQAAEAGQVWGGAARARRARGELPCLSAKRRARAAGASLEVAPLRWRCHARAGA
jgi:hypothetical protein